MRYGWLMIAIFAARFGSTAIAFPAGDGDLAWQRWLGATILRTHAIPRALGDETFTAMGAPWLPQEWAFSLLANAARSGLAWGVFSGCVAAAAVAALALAARHAEVRGASPRAIAVCTGLAGFAMFESFGVRAQVLAWPLLAAFLWLLDTDSAWSYAAILVAVLWSNLHASAMLAPVLAGIYTAGSALDERGIGRRTRRLAAISAGSLVAICCNPFGWHLPAYAIALFDNPIKSYITEWKVTDIDDTSFAFGALPLLLLSTVLSARGDERRWRDVLLLGTLAVLVLSAARNVSIFGLAALPIGATVLSRRAAWFAAAPATAPSRTDRVAAYALPAFSLVLAGIVAIGLVRSAPPPTGLADAPLGALEAIPGEHRLFCADFAWCGLAVGAANVRVFLDGRADPFPRDVWADFVAIGRVDGRWSETLDRRGVDAIVVGKDSGLDQALLLSRAWRAVYVDKTYRLWLRDDGQPLRAPEVRFEALERIRRPG